MALAVIGLGSNVGERGAYLQQAVDRLAALLAGLRVSSVLESQALLPPDAPAEWNVPYYNMAVCGITELAPHALLAQLKALENALGRVERGRWGPREIDLDILAIDELVLDSPSLCVPHPQLLARDFALLPLAELTPDWRYPVPGEYYGWKAARIAEEKYYVPGVTLCDKGRLVHAA